MSESNVERALQEGPLPKVDDDSDLVGEEHRENGGVASEHGGDFVTLPAPGAGSYPVPAVGVESADDENAPADQEAER
jgi:hypothetical protein